jgi:galactitol-specific phosphotransferase system IIB component
MFLLAQIFASSASVADDLTNTLMSDGIEIDNSRILSIPKAHQGEALYILSDKASAPIDKKQLIQILGILPDIDSIQNEIADKAKLAAANNERAAKESRAASTALMLRRNAQKEHEQADNILSLKGKLQPYLVLAKAKNEGSGMFDVHLKGKNLYIVHNSIGMEDSESRPCPVVIYLEYQPQYVAASAVIDR